MANILHTNARTTPKIRAEIQSAPPEVTHAALARRSHVEDGSHRPHTFRTTLTPAQEAIVVAVRELILLSLDDLLVVAREFLCPHLSRSALDRCLRRHGVANLKTLIAPQRGEDDPPPSDQDLQGLCARLYPHRHQVLA